MSKFFSNLKSKFSNSKKEASPTKASAQTEATAPPAEPSYSIQPHPAKTNDPADLQPPGGGLKSGGVMAAHHARDPYIPSDQIKNNLPEPLSREELQARAAELNN
ncbi:hypothetical protein K443DRAFT_680797 [Laccaria amethystina LaAM-08-1]|uniref:Uncharacterized protein n=1 Tax=Laccaria amethystina LaAM-08-1 TaxID=1095629 RepID=A0A0C9XLC2_9AGAR|nr:hypothetical protein K443DRAFT_680797 [Laccaria amethystina LaAM-08-1]